MLALIRICFRLAGLLAPGLAARHATRLFLTPGRHGHFHDDAAAFMQMAQRHDRSFEHGRVAIYQWNALETAPHQAPRILIAHGWSDNAANLLPLIRFMHESGFEIFALDWPAHGLSEGRLTNMREWLITLRELSVTFGPWHCVVAHSLGAFCAGMATRRDMPQFGKPLETDKLVLLAPPEDSLDMLRLFADALHLSPAVQGRMLKRFNAILQADFSDFSLTRVLQQYQGRLLVIHDENDRRVPFEGFRRLRDGLPGQEFLATRGLGHRKILEDRAVLDKIARFLADRDLPVVKNRRAHS